MSKTCVAILAASLTLTPLSLAQDRTGRNDGKSDDMQRAIQFERTKDRDDQRQARKETVHPSVHYDNANRRVKDRNTVPDAGERQWKKDKKIQ